MDDDELEIELRAAPDVAQRCIVLATLIRRLWIETTFASTGPEDWNAEVFDLREWLRAEGVWSSLTDSEAAFLESPAGEESEAAIADVSWQAESLATLGWALGLADTLSPGYDHDISSLVQAVPTPWDDLAVWQNDARLRPEAQIAIERERAEILAWRLAVEAPLRDSTGQQRDDYFAAISEVAEEARSSALLDAGTSNDFKIGGRSIASISDHELERLATLAEERLRALNWLCGFGATWATVPLEI